jgi:hypothetical protein
MKLTSLLSALFLTLSSALAVRAQSTITVTTPITVPNASFESPTSPPQTSNNPNILTGWVFDVQRGSEYGSMTFHSANFSSGGAADGDNYAFINNDYPGVTDTLTSAASLATITPLTTYTLSVAIGNRNGTGLYDDPGNVSFSLLANGVAFATQEVTNGTVPNGTFEDFTLTYETPASGSIIGDGLTIQMATLPEEGSAFQAGFDNVTLDETTIDAAPEPATSLLLVMGGIALIGFAGLRRLNRVPPATGFALISFIAAGMASASADPVDVPDNSFETGGGWTYSEPDIVPGWIFNVPTGGSYGSLFQGACFTTPDALEGNQFAFIDNNVAGTEASLTSAATLGTITADTTYTLTVALGSPDAVFQGGPLDFDPVSGVPPAGATLTLLANGQPFAIDSIPSRTVASGSWQDFSLTYTTTDSDPIVGEELTVQLGTDLNPGEAEEASFDNIQLDASASDSSGDGDGHGDGDTGSGLGTTPEPPSAGLLGLGLAALGSLARWRSRNASI